MSGLHELPESIFRLIESGVVAEFSTERREVVPLDRLWARAHELALQVAAKPPAAIQGSIKAIWQSLDLPRSVALANGLKYCQIGNPVGVPQVNRAAMMADKAKKYTLR